MTQKNLEIGNLVLLIHDLTARGQYSLARVVEVFPDDKGIVRRVPIMTANASKLNTDLPCTRFTLDRNTTKLALIELPAVNPIFGIIHIPESNDVTDKIPETHALKEHNYPISLEPILSGTTLHNSTLSPEYIHFGSSPCKKE